MFLVICFFPLVSTICCTWWITGMVKTRQNYFLFLLARQDNVVEGISCKNLQQMEVPLGPLLYKTTQHHFWFANLKDLPPTLHFIMVNSKNLFKMPRNWQNFAAFRRKRSSLSRNEGSDGNTSPLLAHKGHLFVYTTDQKRFSIPLVYLQKKIFRELLRLSAEEFGLQIDGPITLTCDALFMDYIVMLIEQGAPEHLEKALLMSIATSCCTSISLFQDEKSSKQLLVCSCWIIQTYLLIINMSLKRPEIFFFLNNEHRSFF